MNNMPPRKPGAPYGLAAESEGGQHADMEPRPRTWRLQGIAPGPPLRPVRLRRLRSEALGPTRSLVLQTHIANTSIYEGKRSVLAR